MDIQQQIGEKIRQLRKNRGYSQERFATKSKVHRTYMGLIERGKANITVEQIEKIAKALKISVEEFFKGF
ncbi:MAG: helix-turn-helix domain-containing protein [Candidatus Peribacteria bacterium]|jgi:transcriptional regulator with XRE-family HTH domain|nr:helix-turn-helix domain-containing protein [Candidatus Peribacteria bacterium]